MLKGTQTRDKDIPAADSFRVLQEIYRIPEQEALAGSTIFAL